MKKITILVDQFYKHGGIEKLVAVKSNYWAKVFKYKVSILSTENKGNSLIYDIEPDVSFKDLNCNYNRKISYFSLKNILVLLKNIFKIQIHILKEKPDYIVVASHIPITYILPFLYRGKTKINKEIHFTQFYRSKTTQSFKAKIFSYIEAKYDAIVVLSKEEKTFYNTKNVVVIANPSIQNTNIVQIPIKEKKNIATTIVRFAPVKRIELLLEIWKKLLKKGIIWKLYIYGDADNPYGKKIKDLIKQKSLHKSVFLKGVTNDVYTVLNKSKVSLLVSEQECFPMLILESFSVGVPVISFDCPTGPRNIITNNKDGFLIENNNIEAFVNVFEKFAKNTTLQKSLAKHACQSSNSYTIDRIMNKWQTKIFK